jgi:hypothetical protein
MIIPLRDALLRRFSNLPAGSGYLLRGLSAWAHRADTPLPPGEWRRSPCLFGLAPCGVYHAASVTSRAVRSYRTLSPLPSLLALGRRYVFCCTGRPDALKHPSRTLSGTLPCGVRTFLPRSTACAASGSDHPAACMFISVAQRRMVKDLSFVTGHVASLREYDVGAAMPPGIGAV